MENMVTKTELVELVENRTKVKCSLSWILTEGLTYGFIKNKSKDGTKILFTVDTDVFDKWVSEYTVPDNYVSLRKAEDYGLSYMVARNASDRNELNVKILGFGTERMQYADKDELRKVGSNHNRRNIQ